MTRKLSQRGRQGHNMAWWSRRVYKLLVSILSAVFQIVRLILNMQFVCGDGAVELKSEECLQMNNMKFYWIFPPDILSLFETTCTLAPWVSSNIESWDSLYTYYGILNTILCDEILKIMYHIISVNSQVR